MVLLDTHVVLWLALEPRLISSAATEAMVLARKQEALSIAGCTLWEIALLHARSKIRLEISLAEFLLRVERTYQVLPLTRLIAIRGVQFTGAFPRDPADRQIAATALVQDMPLITADGAIRASGEVSCIW